MINREPSLNLALQRRAGCLLATTSPLPGRRLVLAMLERALWTVALVLLAFQAGAGVVFTSLHSFSIWPNGADPEAVLVRGTDGNFYGTTAGGGMGLAGTVFKITTNGVLTSLYSFSGGNDGSEPEAGLALGSDGNFYGTTFQGGTSLAGTVFKITPNGALTSLYSFTGGNDGTNPQGGLVQGSDGIFYGTTAGGGTNNAGTVFKITTNGMLTSLYSFTGGNDGASPEAGLAESSDGNFYGTTAYGGTNLSGTVFKISPTGGLTSLYSFVGGYDGANPYAGLALGSNGNFYGTTSVGGTNGFGTVFKISANGSLTCLFAFADGDDGANPRAGLAAGSDGNFYGTTFSYDTNHFGSVFKISTTGTLTGLYSFFRVYDGANPEAGLVQGSDSSFYGTTFGNLIGTNHGTVFKITTNGALASLYSFTGGNDGAFPAAGLARGSDGSFYGTTYGGGTNNDGTVFKITTNRVVTNLYSFTGGNDGSEPQARLVQASDGNFYGTTAAGGSTIMFGTVFKITTNGVVTSLYSFTGGNDGAHPYAGLVQGSDGNFYGTTENYGGTNYSGTVFKISPNGLFTNLYSFNGGSDGGYPYAGLVEGSGGYFYGTTTLGGTNGAGTVFRISTSGALTSLYSFTGGHDGANPQAELVRGGDGYYYGTTANGGTNNYGTVFKISSSGVLASLYSFTGGVDGASPVAGLLQGSDGSFYGTTYSGGSGGAGTVFRLTLVRAAAPVFQMVNRTNSTLSLAWSTEAAETYQLQYNSDLNSSNWTDLDGPITATAATLQATDSIATNGQQRFYRVVVLP